MIHRCSQCGLAIDDVQRHRCAAREVLAAASDVPLAAPVTDPALPFQATELAASAAAPSLGATLDSTARTSLDALRRHTSSTARDGNLAAAGDAAVAHGPSTAAAQPDRKLARLAIADQIIGTTLSDRYQVLRRIGHGGMGAVYAARHVVLDSPVAVKVLLSPHDLDSQQRFLREAKLASKVAHPNTVYISDFGVLPSGLLYLVMEYLPGRTLADVLSTGPLAIVRCCRLALSIARGLLAVHEKGIVHRDLKPANIFVLRAAGNDDPQGAVSASDAAVASDEGDEIVKIVDFGIAKLADVAVEERDAAASERGGGLLAAPLAEQTAAGAVMGTPYYLSPEQAAGGATDARADQYSLGCILFEMVTGSVPFVADTLPALLEMHRTAPPVRLGQLRPDGTIPPALEDLVARLLQKRPQDRYASLAEVIQALTAILAERTAAALQVAAPPIAVHGAGPLRGRGARWAAACAALCVIALGALALWRLGRGGAHDAGAGRAGRALTSAELETLQGAARGVLQRDLLAEPPLLHGALRAVGQTGSDALRPDVARHVAATDATTQRLALATLVWLGDGAARSRVAAMLRGDAGDLRLRSAFLFCDLKPALGNDAGLAAALAQSTQGLADAVAHDAIPAPILLDALLCVARAAPAGATRQAARDRLQAQFQAEAAAHQRIPSAARLLTLGDATARDYLRDLARRRGPDQLPAALALATEGDLDAASLFRDVIRRPQTDATARQLAAEGLGLAGDVEDARLLGEALRAAGAGPPALRQAVAVAILRLGALDPAALSRGSLGWAVVALSDAGWAQRAAAVDVLALSRASAATRLLTTMLRDPDDRVRRGALRALARRPGVSTVHALQAGLADVSPDVRLAAVVTLRQVLGRLLVPDLDRIRSQVQGWMRALIQAADSPGGDAPSSGSSSGAMAGQPQIAARLLLLWLGDGGQRAWLQTQQATGDAATRRALVEQGWGDAGWWRQLLQDGDAAVRWAAAERLATLGDAAGRGELVAALGQGGAQALRAYGLLGRLGSAVGGERPAGFLTQILSRLGAGAPDEVVALVQASALLQVDDALTLLGAASHSVDRAVRAAVLQQVAMRFVDAGRGEGAPGIPTRADAGRGGAVAPEPDDLTGRRVDALLRRLSQDGDAAIRMHAGMLLSRSRGDVRDGTQQAGATADEDALLSQADRRHQASPAQTDAGVSGDGGVDGGAPGVADAGDAADGEAARAGADAGLAGEIERIFRSAAAADRHGDAARTIGALNRMRALCSRAAVAVSMCDSSSGAIAYLLARSYAQQGMLPEAMTEYQRALQAGGSGKLAAAQRGDAQRAVVRLTMRLGQIVIGTRQGRGCKQETVWVLPGVTSTVRVGTARQTVVLQAGQVQRIGDCP